MAPGSVYAPVSALVAIMNNKADFARAQYEHWYRIPVRSAPPRVDFARLERLAFYQTKVFGPEKWAVNYHAEVRSVDRVKRIELLQSACRLSADDRIILRLLGACQLVAI
jgi:hypothetical protein